VKKLSSWGKIINIIVLLISLSLLIIYEFWFRTYPLIEIIELAIIGLLLQISFTAVIFLWWILPMKKKRGKESKKIISPSLAEKEEFIMKGFEGLEQYSKKIGITSIAISSAIVAIKEEIIFRGPLLAIVLFLELPLWIWPLLIIADGIIFGIFHFRENPLFLIFISALFFGIIYSWLVITTKSIIPSIICHSFWDWTLKSFLYLIFYLPKKEDEISS
jgi:membrane protease YdiL (CAAX protease family)